MPEPADFSTCSCPPPPEGSSGMLKKRRNIGSSMNGCWKPSTVLSVWMLQTAGMARAATSA